MFEESEQHLIRLGDASIASPFTARRTSIESVLTVIRQGIYSLTHSLIHSLTYLLTYLLTYSCKVVAHWSPLSKCTRYWR